MDSPRLHHSSFARSVENMIDVWHRVIIRELSLALTLNPGQMKVDDDLNKGLLQQRKGKVRRTNQ